MEVIPYLLVGFPSEVVFLRELSLLFKRPRIPFIEVGLPARRPYLDGETIRAAQRQIRQAGWTLERALGFLADQFQGEMAARLILMGYWRDVCALGLEAFEERIRGGGFGGVLLVGRRRELLDRWSIRTLPLIPVVTVRDSEETLEPFRYAPPPFFYLRVSSGKTGEKKLLSEALLRETLEKLRKLFPGIPVFAGFGVQDWETAKMLREIGFSGVVVGSALLRRLAEGCSLDDFLRELEEL